MSVASIERCLWVIFAAFMIAVPWLIPALINAFWVSVIAEILIWSLFAASVNLLFGYVGLLSFGQALYFGFGMYGVAIGIQDLGLSFWPAFGLGIVASMAMALVTGIFAVRLTWHYFAIITVVFSLIFYFLALSNKWLTGGDDGINFTLPPTFNIGGFSKSFTDLDVPVFLHPRHRRILLLADASPDREPARQGVSRDPRQRRARVADRPQRLSAAADRVRAGGLPGRRRGRAVRLLRALRLGKLHVLSRVGRSRGVGDRRRRRHPARARGRDDAVHHRPRDRVDPLGASLADRRRGRDPGRDLRAEGRGRLVERLDRPHRRAPERRPSGAAKLRTEP